MKKDVKSKVVKLRLSEYTYGRLKEASEVLGLKQSTIMRNGVEMFISEIYNSDGCIKEKYTDRAKELGSYQRDVRDDPDDADWD